MALRGVYNSPFNLDDPVDMKLGRKENVSQFYIYLNVAAKEMAPVGAFSVIVKLCLDRLQL